MPKKTIAEFDQRTICEKELRSTTQTNDRISAHQKRPSISSHSGGCDTSQGGN